MLIQSLIKPFGLIKYHLSERMNDWNCGIRTTAFLIPKELENAGPEQHPYLATEFHLFRHAISQISIDPEKDVFLDYGSGMGRVMIMAATYPFRRVIGVEISRQLSDVARRNIATTKLKLKCRNIDVVNVDARNFKVPADVTVVYLFSPFSGGVLKQVLESVHLSVAKNPRDVRILYASPPNANCLDEIKSQLTWLVDHHVLVAAKHLSITMCHIRGGETGSYPMDLVA